MNQKICPECGYSYIPVYGAVTQIFCSKKCRDSYVKKRGLYNRPSITFECANPKCGRIVVTDGYRDMRTRFCCAECERAYWKHAYRNKNHERQNFRSLQEYESWERKTNRET